MKYFTLYIFLLFSILLGAYISGCRSQRPHPTTYTGKQIVFGTGGGFTGEVSTFLLLDNGYLFSMNTDKNSGKENYIPLKKLSGKITRQLFSKAHDLQIEQAQFSHPGNMYYFIELKNTQGAHRLIWGDSRHPAPVDAENLYHQLTASLSQ